MRQKTCRDQESAEGSILKFPGRGQKARRPADGQHRLLEAWSAPGLFQPSPCWPSSLPTQEAAGDKAQKSMLLIQRGRGMAWEGLK